MAKETTEKHYPNRRTPASGAHLYAGQLNIFFLTVCTRNRVPWLANDAVLQALRNIWTHDATRWLVGDFLLMPDHLHLFCAPRDTTCSIDRWIAFWKDRFAKRTSHIIGRFQRRAFHHRLRSYEALSSKYNYMRLNPVRKQLVDDPETWPFRGCIHQISGGQDT